jgi:hypothetical protein
MTPEAVREIIITLRIPEAMWQERGRRYRVSQMIGEMIDAVNMDLPEGERLDFRVQGFDKC